MAENNRKTIERSGEIGLNHKFKEHCMYLGAAFYDSIFYNTLIVIVELLKMSP